MINFIFGKQIKAVVLQVDTNMLDVCDQAFAQYPK